jgi:hypothetical protein
MPKVKFKKLVIIVSSLLLFVLICLGVGYYTLVYALTPASIRDPKPEHLHFRMQIVTDEKNTDFSDPKFQEVYSPGSCSFTLTQTPIHFHDKKDQIVHIHWTNITGGQVLKYYGIDPDGNLLMKDKMGYRLESGKFWPEKIPTSGKPFGENVNKEWFVEKGYKIYVYSGEKESFTKRPTQDFMNKNVEDFFGKKSIVTGSNSNFDIWNLFSVPVLADDSSHNSGSNTKDVSLPVQAHDSKANTFSGTKEHTEEELKEINNLIGNVVIFIQKEEPSREEVQERFDRLVELSPSVCGG